MRVRWIDPEVDPEIHPGVDLEPAPLYGTLSKTWPSSNYWLVRKDGGGGWLVSASRLTVIDKAELPSDPAPETSQQLLQPGMRVWWNWARRPGRAPIVLTGKLYSVDPRPEQQKDPTWQVRDLVGKWWGLRASELHPLVEGGDADCIDVERMRPVVDAACEWLCLRQRLRQHPPSAEHREYAGAIAALAKTVDTYLRGSERS
jgi:hypothetical protein